MKHTFISKHSSVPDQRLPPGSDFVHTAPTLHIGRGGIPGGIDGVRLASHVPISPPFGVMPGWIPSSLTLETLMPPLLPSLTTRTIIQPTSLIFVWQIQNYKLSCMHPDMAKLVSFCFVFHEAYQWSSFMWRTCGHVPRQKVKTSPTQDWMWPPTGRAFMCEKCWNEYSKKSSLKTMLLSQSSPPP